MPSVGRKTGPTQAELEARQGGECRGCGELIYWVKVNGKPHPVERGREVAVVFADGEFEIRGAYRSHFARCPKAGEFRRG